MNGACELVRTCSRRSSPRQARQPCVSRCTCCTREVEYVRSWIDVGLLEALRDAAELAVNVDVDVVVKGDAPVVQDGRARRHRRFRIEHGGKQLVVDLEQAAGLFRGGLGLGHDGRDPLPDEADDIVEDVGVVGIDEVVLVGRRAVEPARDILPGEDGDDARHRRGLVALDGFDARMRMRRAQHLEMQHVLHRRHVERVARLPRHDRLGEWAAEAGSAGAAGDILFDGFDAVERVDDALIARAAAEIALEHARQVAARRLVEGGGRHDHAGGAEAALKRLRVEKRLLHGMQLAVLCKALDRRDLRVRRRETPAPGSYGTACRRARPCRRRSLPCRSPS